MPQDEYSTGGGGKLKLKGSKVGDGRVEKKKKKKGVKKEKKGDDRGVENSAEKDEQARGRSRELQDDGDGMEGAIGGEREEGEGSSAKTEAERKYDEVRRKRVCSFSSLLRWNVWLTG